MIDWKSKLTSRKFWAAVCALVTNLILAFNGAKETAVQVTAIIMAGAAVIAYIIGEGLTDAAHVNDGILEFTVEDDADATIPDDGDDRK